MDLIKTLKKFDLFSLPVNTFYTSRDKKSNKKSYHIFHGSQQGGCLTILFGMTLTFILVEKMINMFSGDLDITRQETFTNPMDSVDTSVANIHDSNFMASV